MIDSVHINDSTIYGPSWVDPELRPLFAEQNSVKGWLDVMTVLAEIQAEFGLIPLQAALEIKTAYENLEIDEAVSNRSRRGFCQNQSFPDGIDHCAKESLRCNRR